MNSVNTSFSGNVPANYDQYLGPLFFEPYALDIVSRVKQAGVQRVLEIACGTGRVTNHLRKKIPGTAALIATDINAGMIAIARQSLPNENIDFSIADAQSLPFDDNSFDLIVCQFGFMFAPDKPAAFKEAFRVLKKGGVVLFNTWDKIENNPLTNTVKSVITEFFTNSNAADFYNVPHSMYKKEDIILLLKDAGFTNINIEIVPKEAIAFSASNVAKGVIMGTPAFKTISDIDASAPDKIISITEKKIAALYGDNPLKSALSALVTEASK